MDWRSVALAGAGGGLGAVIGMGLAMVIGRFAPERWRSALFAAFATLGALAGAFAAPKGANLIFPPPPASGGVAAAEIESEMLRDPMAGPLFQAWKEVDPDSYRVYLETLARGADKGDSLEELINAGRERLVAQAAPGMARLDDAQTVEWALITAAQMRELQGSHPASCVAMLRGQPLGDLRPYLKRATMAREAKLLTSALRASSSPLGPSLTSEEAAAESNLLVEELHRQFGLDVALLAPNADVAGKEARVCELGAAMFDAVVKKPAPEAAKLLRSMLLTA